MTSLPTAAPYAGSAQHVELNTAIRLLVEGSVLHAQRWDHFHANVTGRSYIYIDDVLCHVASLAFGPGLGKQWSDTDDDQMNAALAALRCAGWTVTDAEAPHWFYAYGPGIEGWAGNEKVRRAQAAQQQAQSKETQEVAAAEYRRVLVAAGVSAFVNRTTGTAALTLDDVRKIVAATLATPPSNFAE